MLDVYVYDLHLNVWRNVSQVGAPTAREACACEAVNNNLYVIGGFDTKIQGT